MKRFKKIYVEITNACNLNCSFCIGNSRKIESISIDKFKILLDKLISYTDYLYFHILGEPLMHKDINELIDIASSNFNVNITTNGVLIDEKVDVLSHPAVRQINISLHSFNGNNLNEYLNNIYESVDKLLDNNTIELTEDDLVICDIKEPMALAGIKGGLKDSILKETTGIVLEVASFTAPTIRKSSKRFNEKTDAAIRFEKGIDTERVDSGLSLALSLIEEIFPDSKIV